MIKGSIWKDVACLNIYEPNSGAPKYQYIKQILTDKKRELDSNTIIVGDFNIPPTSIDRKSIKKHWPYMTHKINEYIYIRYI